MDALTALIERVSTPRLGGMAPSEEALGNMFRAALRAPDHAQLRPWRFLVVREDRLPALGELFLRALLQDNPDATAVAREKTRNKPLRAPMIVVAIASVTDHPKVPATEQVISAGAAVQNLMVAAWAQDVGAMWRTGSMAYHPVVRDGLGIAGNEQIVGFVYLGQVDGNRRTATHLPLDDFVEEWAPG